MAAKQAILVNPADLEVRTEALAGLPVINAVLDRIGFDAVVGEHLPQPDARVGLDAARAIAVVVRNLAIGRRPLYGMAAWAAGFDPGALGLFAGEAALLNDDRVGRALDQLFLADRATMTTALSVAAIKAYDISIDELHNDSTSICLYGAYRDATGAPHGGIAPPVPTWGHSKDHRPDLKQLVWILTVSADGSVPVCFQMADGNTEDSTTHIATWDTCVNIAGRADFLYIGDRKLATRNNMDHIATHGGRFLTVLPRSRKEDETGRAWLAAGPIPWTEIARRPGKRIDDPPEVHCAVPAPTCSAEGYRICWIRSSTKQAHDAIARAERIERSLAALGELAATLVSARCRLHTRVAVEDAANAILAKAGTARWVRFTVGEETTCTYRQERRGRPGPATRYRQINNVRFTLSYSTDTAQVATDAASDGCVPFITNDEAMTAAHLASYKTQPHIERRHATFKGVLEAVPVELKSDRRIDALGFCLYAALLVHALIERQLRQAMAAAAITTLPLYHEDRACKAPTATRVLELLDPLARTVILHRRSLLALQEPTLNPLQTQILTLLDVPTDPYGRGWPAGTAVGHLDHRSTPAQ